MPAFIGPVQIFNVNGGVAHIGDTVVISPKTNTKTTSGAGSNSVGAIVFAATLASANNTLDTNLIDQPTIGNN
ncbi:spore germination protein [Lederbergia citrea]|uniref:Spore germination protein n=1 Tax=Lederbergia citrea TaxID=2833581 RepID=A0A942UQT7_9BACI|nr:spore germination protein [Lederbergia citrea]MBS4177433.1 spore germination protein [Lederbergia citrea]MBS4204111.1 spore germination protein [Lederbergia citrea]MBS4221304.1 spore germination protein [Lederbergia citrea]